MFFPAGARRRECLESFDLGTRGAAANALRLLAAAPPLPSLRPERFALNSVTTPLLSCAGSSLRYGVTWDYPSDPKTRRLLQDP